MAKNGQDTTSETATSRLGPEPAASRLGPGTATATPPGQASAVLEAAPKRAGLLDRFLVLKGATRELWVVFAVHLLAYVGYKLLNVTWALWLTYDLGYSDQAAGYWVFGWSALMTLFAVMVGSLTDAIGLRKALLLGLWVGIIARVVLTFSNIPWLALAGGMIPVALGEALGTPALVAAVRRFSTTSQRSISFSIFYATMNIGILLTLWIFDAVRHGLGEFGNWTILGFQLTTYRTLFLISILFELTLIPLLYSLRNIEATDEGPRPFQKPGLEPNVACRSCGYNLTGNVSGICPECGVEVDVPAAPAAVSAAVVPEGTIAALWHSMSAALRETGRIFAGLWGQPGFYKFLAFLSLAAFVRLIFVQMDYTYPKFGIRELGPGAPVGHLYNINAGLIIFLVPLVGALSQRISAYRMVVVGSAIAASSVFIMVLPPAWFQSMADGPLGHWVGHKYLGLTGPVNPWYVMIFLFVLILSVGEAFYSPRLYEYAAVIAPKGQEASYMSLSYLPFFLAKMTVAFFSGKLLAAYCPETGPRNSNMLWLVIALTTMICPLGLMLFGRFIRVREEGRE